MSIQQQAANRTLVALIADEVSHLQFSPSLYSNVSYQLNNLQPPFSPSLSLSLGFHNWIASSWNW